MSTPSHTDQQTGFSLEEIEKIPAPLLDKNPDKAIGQVSTLMDRLCNFYSSENDVLKNADSRGFLSLQTEKMILARHYKEVLKQVRIRQNDLKTARPCLKEELEQRQSTFRALADENRKLLKRMENGTERLHKRVVDAVKRAANKKQVHGYGHTGHMAALKTRRVSTGLEETV